MAETPMDIIMKHLSAEAGKVQPLANVAAVAAAIDTELRGGFTVIANEEIDAVEVVHKTINGSRYLIAGSGPEEASCGVESNPNWLRNRAVNELAIARSLERKQGIRLPDTSHGREFGRFLSVPMTDAELTEAMRESARMPIVAAPRLPEGTEDITIRATGDPMVWYIGTDKAPRRLDDGFPPNSQGFPSGREAQIALALVDISASRLHKVTR